MLDRAYSTELTFRERQILGYVAKGHSNPEIAKLLGLSRNTVKTYLQVGYQKLGARNRVQAIRLAEAAGALVEEAPPAPSPPPRPPLTRVDPIPTPPAEPCARPCLPEVLAMARRVAARLAVSEPPEVAAMREAWAEVEVARVAALERMHGRPPVKEAVVEQPPADQVPVAARPPVEDLVAPATPGGDPWAYAHVKWT